MRCYRCGTEVPDGSRFCTSCGTQVTDPGAATVMVASRAEDDALLVALRADLGKDYEIERELGRGGMAVVYKAHELELGRDVALKVLPPGTTGEMAERFRREARTAAQLDHPNIIPVYRVGQAAGTHFFAMKYVEGRAVDAIVAAQGALSVPVVLAILRGAVAGLAYAHERHIVHRDIKGANILIERDGRILLSDLGIARAAEDKTLTATGAVIGTPHFMSPEQCSGQKVGPQSDQYAIGVLAFQLLTGQVPFDADTLMGILHHHFFSPPPSIAEVRDGVPESLQAVVYRAMQKDPANRYATTGAMLRAIEAVPYSHAEREVAAEQLRKLAEGCDDVPRVRTRSLPPLTVTGAAAATAVAAPGTVPAAPAAAARRWPSASVKRRRRVLPFVAGTVLVAAAGGAALLLTRGGGGPAPSGDSVAAALGSAAGAPARADSASDAVPRPPADTQPAPPIAPPPVATGTLVLSGVPAGSRVRIDGAEVSGREHRLSPGTHRVEISAEGYREFSRTATVQAGRRHSLRVAMEAVPAPAPQAVETAPADSATIRLSIDPPDATIVIDGKTAGLGSVFDYRVPAGRPVHIVVSAAGHLPLDSTFRFRPDERRNLRRWVLRPAGGGP
jgi:predicted Ser/Thr protein kinase